VKALGNTSITLGFEIDNQAAARIADFEAVLVCTDRTTLAKRLLPDELRSALSRFAA
jgi:acyl-CoA thioesterase FadM